MNTSQLRQTLPSILSHLSEAVICTDEELNIILFNQRAEEIFGYREEEALNQPLEMLLPEDFTAVHRRRVQDFIDSEKRTRPMNNRRPHIRGRRKDGSRFPLQIGISKIKRDDGRLLLTVIINDISPQAEAEQKLQESKKRYASIFDNTHAAMLIINPATADIIDANPAACRFYGYNRNTLLSKKITDINILQENSVYSKMERAGAELGGHFHFRHRLADGAIRDVEVYSGPIEIDGEKQLFSVIHDITERKQAERELLQANTLLEKTFASLQAGIFLINARTRVITHCNAAGERIFGFSEAEMVGRTTEFLHINREQYEQFGREMEQALNETGVFDTEYRLRRRDGRIFHSEHTVTGITDDDGERIRLVSVVRDIDRRKQVEQQLRQFSRVVEQSPDAIIITDTDGRIEYVNPKFTQMTGYTLAEIAGRNPRLLQSGQTAPTVYREMWQTLSSGAEWRGEMLNRKKNGDLYWVSASIAPVTNQDGKITHYLAVEEDITSQKKTEQTLRQRNRELTLLNRAGHTLSSTLELDKVLTTLLEEVRRLLNVLACSVWLRDPETDELVCRQMTDAHADAVVGWRLQPGVGLSGWVVENRRSLVVADAWNDERHFRGVDEKTRLRIRSILTVPLLGKQEVIGVIQVVDVQANRFEESDLVLVESLAAAAAGAIENARLFTELKEAQQQLIQRERLAALGQMAATVAHELRNPLMAIRMGVEYMVSDIPADDPRRRGAALMQTNMNRIDRIVEDILFVSRSPRPNLAPGLLRPIIEQEVERWEFTLKEKQLTLHTQLAADMLPVEFDPEHIARALTNLIGNSVDVLPPGGAIHLQLSSKGDNQVITLQDSGPGISSEHLKKVFDPFFTTKSRGTGLGLSIVKQIIDYHHGQIEAKSEPGQGAQFTIRLPILK